VGTKVKIKIIRKGEDAPREIELTRENISVPVIKTEKDKSGVFIIRLYSFTATAPKLFQDALKEFAETKGDKLILDVRGNPGGYLEAAVDMASWFLPKDTVIVREVHRSDPEKTYPSVGYNVFSKNLKMVILMDGGSASASEILAGALSEYKIATLMGNKTFGKGSVQELVPITSDTSLKVTIARWFTPKGHSISQNGLEPDIRVDVTKDDLAKAYDRQQAAAIEFLTTGRTNLATTTATILKNKNRRGRRRLNEKLQERF
jgi:carboxyl-terminal processing protease